MIKGLIISLALTLAVESIMALILGVRDKKGLITVALANVITNPAVVFISALTWHFCGPEIYTIIVTVLEIAVLVIESYIYKKILWDDSWGQAIRISLILNFCSYFAGEIINMI